MAADTIISPFDAASTADLDDFVSDFRIPNSLRIDNFHFIPKNILLHTVISYKLINLFMPMIRQDDDDDDLELTRENVEMVLDEMRPYLQADG